MDASWAAYAAAFWLGAVHALEVDHMVAVTALVGSRPRVGAAVSYAARWGLGHSLVLLAVGGTLAWTRVGIPDSVIGWTEVAVGVTLVGVGVWALRAAYRLHLHDPVQHGGHAHLHTHSPKLHPHSHDDVDVTRRHRHLSTLVGAVHGLVGTAPIVALIPVTLIANPWTATGYLTVFAAGTVLAMGLYAALAALALSRAASSIVPARVIAVATALGSAVVGVWWISGATF